MHAVVSFRWECYHSEEGLASPRKEAHRAVSHHIDVLFCSIVAYEKAKHIKATLYCSKGSTEQKLLPRACFAHLDTLCWQLIKYLFHWKMTCQAC